MTDLPHVHLEATCPRRSVASCKSETDSVKVKCCVLRSGRIFLTILKIFSALSSKNET